MWSFTLLAMVGVVAGTRLGRRFSPGRLRQGFAGLLVAVAGFILYQSLTTP
jgi:uncharacterized membrane protein YfcA